MRKNRFMPFGYTMENGEILPHPKESLVVKNIFRLYLTGTESYSSLARTLSKGEIPYHKHTSLWNKNMIKRILENTGYLGEGDYPQLIDKKDFHDVEAIISSRAPINIPTYKRTYKTEYLCGHCAKDLAEKGIQDNILVCINPSCTQYNIMQTLESIRHLVGNTESTSQKITQLTIQRKTELQSSSPREDELLRIAEEFAQLSIKKAISSRGEIIKFPLSSTLEESFSPYKRVILFSNRIQIL